MRKMFVDASVHGFMHGSGDFFLLYDNLFIYQVLCTLINRRRSLYSFLSYCSYTHYHTDWDTALYSPYTRSHCLRCAITLLQHSITLSWMRHHIVQIQCYTVDCGWRDYTFRCIICGITSLKHSIPLLRAGYSFKHGTAVPKIQHHIYQMQNLHVTNVESHSSNAAALGARYSIILFQTRKMQQHTVPGYSWQSSSNMEDSIAIIFDRIASTMLHVVTVPNRCIFINQIRSSGTFSLKIIPC